MVKRKPKDWAADQDYWSKLSSKEKKWLEQFNSEFYYANFTKDREAIHPEWYKEDCGQRRYRMAEDVMRTASFVDPDRLHTSESDD